MATQKKASRAKAGKKSSGKGKGKGKSKSSKGGRAPVQPQDIGGNNKILVSKGKDVNWNGLIGNDGDMAILWNGDNPYTGNLTELKINIFSSNIVTGKQIGRAHV